MPRSLFGAIGWGAVLIALVVGALVALTRDIQPYPIVVIFGIGTTLTVVLNPRSPYRDEIQRLIGDPATSLYLLLLILSLALQGGFIPVFVITYRQSPVHPCACFSDHRGREWLDVMLWAGMLSWLELVLLSVVLLSLYRLIRGRPDPPQ
jgi:hypothetical protein